MDDFDKPVFKEIDKRLKALSIDIKKYIYVNPKTNRPTLQVAKTTLDGISFSAGQNLGSGKSILGQQSILGDHALKGAISNAKAGNGLRAFAGQIKKEDLNNLQLQASFLATKGLGFREIFYLPDQIVPARDMDHRVLLNQDNRLYDLKFGRMVDSPDVTSIHVDMASESVTSIHLDKQGFIFAGRDGKIRLSSNVAQHVFDELILKDKFLGMFGDGRIPTALKNNVTLFSHLNYNSISDPTLGRTELQNNQFLRNSRIRGILGLEASYSSNRLQLFTRGSLGMEISNDKQLSILSKDYSGVIGIRGTF